MSIRSRTAVLAAAVLVIAGCAAVPSTPAPPAAVSRFGWIADLAGCCWRQSGFAADVCYWVASPEAVYWFSRNRQELLGCGRFVMATAGARRGFIYSWDDDSADPVMIFTLTDDALMTDENAESPRGLTQRISRDRFSVQDRPGAPPLVFTRKQSLSATDPGKARCLEWEATRR
jgi:hypothetical protein